MFFFSVFFHANFRRIKSFDTPKHFFFLKNFENFSHIKLVTYVFTHIVSLNLSLLCTPIQKYAQTVETSKMQKHGKTLKTFKLSKRLERHKKTFFLKKHQKNFELTNTCKTWKIFKNLRYSKNLNTSEKLINFQNLKHVKNSKNFKNSNNSMIFYNKKNLSKCFWKKTKL